MSAPATVAEYLKSLPADRRKALQAVRKVIKANLDSGYSEGLAYGMIGYGVKHSVYPDGYHCDPKQKVPYLALASQKNYMSLYLFCLYSDSAELKQFERDWKAAGKKLNMGKSCVRFKSIDDVPLDVVANLVKKTPAAKFLTHYEAGLGESGRSAKGRKPKAKAKARAKAKGKAKAKSKAKAKAKTRAKAKRKAKARA